MANAKVTVTGTSAPNVSIKFGDTVTWEGVSDFQIHLPAPYSNPSITHNPVTGKYHGTSAPFGASSNGKAYKVPYAISANGAAADPDIEVQPGP